MDSDEDFLPADDGKLDKTIVFYMKTKHNSAYFKNYI
jgi:hypothetical protein